MVSEAEHYSRVLEKSNTPRPTDIRNRIREVSEAVLQAKLAMNALEPKFWPYIGVVEEHEFEKLTNGLDALSQRLTESADIAGKLADNSNRRPGGPTKDRRIPQYVDRLSRLFWIYVRKRPTGTVKDGEPASPFGKFVSRCFQYFYPDDDPVPHRAVREAIVETANNLNPKKRNKINQKK